MLGPPTLVSPREPLAEAALRSAGRSAREEGVEEARMSMPADAATPLPYAQGRLYHDTDASAPER